MQKGVRVSDFTILITLPKIVETGKAIFLEHDTNTGPGTEVDTSVFEEEENETEAQPMETMISAATPAVEIVGHMEDSETDAGEDDHKVDAAILEVVNNDQVITTIEAASTTMDQHQMQEGIIDITTNLRKSSRVKKPTTLEHFVYLAESDINLLETF
ncbi:hypothetical protein FF1_013561 [Malus domestica]